MRNRNPRFARSRAVPVPHFESGLIAEPLLMFGGNHTHVDPKTGLALYGPYTLPRQQRPDLRSITVGMVGPPAMLPDAEGWLRACQGQLANDGSQPFLYPHFPGFQESAPPFSCELVFGETWRESIRDVDLKVATETADYFARVQAVVRLYIRAIEVLASRDPKPNVILCCIPQTVIDTCTVMSAHTRRRRLPIEPKKPPSRQLDIFSLIESAASEDEEGSPHQNLRRGLKAEAMQFGIPTQLVWPKTLRLAAAQGGGRVQDISTRAWNFTTALYHKAGGSPWRLADIDPGVCFVGVSFFREVLEENPSIRTSMAQAFTAAGDGYVLRGASFEWNERDGGRSPHLTKPLAAALLQDVIELYKRQNRGSLPTRLVLHKSSKFFDDELDGFTEAAQAVPQKDFVALGARGLQFYRTGDYPALRGTYVKFSDDDLLLYTSGYVPYLRTYPGARVPRPIEVLQHFGDSPWDVVLRELLALTKMNWNTADFSCAEPITIAFSRRVGEVLAEVAEGRKVRPEYRFYM